MEQREFLFSWKNLSLTAELQVVELRQLFQLHMVEVRLQLNCCETDFFLVSDSQIFSGLRLITRRSGWSQRLAYPSCQVEPLGLNEEVLVRNMLERDYQNFVSAGVSGNPHNCSFEILRETLGFQ